MQEMFRLNRHNAIHQVLCSFNSDLFQRADCFFGGGTAIVLNLDEYRESVDIDFLCASKSGYRMLRQAVWEVGIKGLMNVDSEVRSLREMRTDQYGIRTVLQIQDTPIKFEIVREGRIALRGAIDRRYGVPVLAREDMYTEKLLANTDRWADRAVLSRDIIDISMMISRWGAIPEAAWGCAKGAYGDTVADAYHKAVDFIRNPNWLQECMEKMNIDPELAGEILAPHGGPKAQEAHPFDD